MAESTLVINLAFAAAAAAIGGAIATRLRLSAIVGFIAAGVAIGPFTPGFVGDAPSIRALADIGIIFLMFAIGVQFSPSDLLRLGRVATVGATAQVVLTIGLGLVAGMALGWGWLEALFLGAIVSNSSSTVLIKILDERGELDAQHGRIALSWSVVQDLQTIVLVVLLTALSGSGDDALSTLVIAPARAALFIGAILIIGQRLLPWLLDRTASIGSREVFILAVVALALMTAYLSSLFGVSIALGAFIAGLVVSESDLSYHILGELLPVRDIFVGIFFVSVGMLVDPRFLVENVGEVLLVLALIVVGKGLLSASTTALFGYGMRTSLFVGVALAQSAEFSFLLARIGLDLEALDEHLFTLALAGTVLSIVLAPALYQSAPRLAGIAERLLGWRTQLQPVSEAIGEPGRLGRHSVICGYGRVGMTVGQALGRRSLPFVVIEQDRRLVHELRQQGIKVVYGNAASLPVLQHADVASCRTLVVTTPDPIIARQVVSLARRLNARTDIVVRTQSAAERDALIRLGATEVVLGDLEIGLEMTRHALHRFGVGTLEIQAILQGLRQQAGPDAT